MLVQSALVDPIAPSSSKKRHNILSLMKDREPSTELLDAAMSPIRDWQYTRMSRHTPPPEPRPDWVEKQQHRPATRASPMGPRDRFNLSQNKKECFPHHTISRDSTQRVARRAATSCLPNWGKACVALGFV
uniref:Uncharacterized protein n=1 Tax=Bionectria ochroleuca TaxID=29856 RepID=A0A8H7N620_BIOOC